MLNLKKLDKKLREMGLTIHGVDANGVITWINSPTPQQVEQAKFIIDNFDENVPLLSEILDARAKLLTATDWTELPSQDRKDWIEWRKLVREWKQGECPIPPNENEYCLKDIWDIENHKPKFIFDICK